LQKIAHGSQQEHDCKAKQLARRGTVAIWATHRKRNQHYRYAQVECRAKEPEHMRVPKIPGQRFGALKQVVDSRLILEFGDGAGRVVVEGRGFLFDKHVDKCRGAPILPADIHNSWSDKCLNIA